MRETAAIITVGTELVAGLRLDTNTKEIAEHLSGLGFDVVESMSVGDDPERLTAAVRRLAADCAAVVVTGGLGPTHDDITREGVAAALGLSMSSDPDLLASLESIVSRHPDPQAAAQIGRQALLIEGATAMPATSGTAPGQIIEAGGCKVVLLPGPPKEMRPMLALAFEGRSRSAVPRVMRCVGLGESDAQLRAQRALGDMQGVALTVLAKPSLVDVILLDEGGGDELLATAADTVREALGEFCYGDGDTTLAQAVLELARSADVRIGCAESCTGGMISAALTDVPGSSDVFVGGVVAYSNEAKSKLLGVSPEVIASDGAVSERVAIELAEGAISALGADVAVSATGVAGPGGGTESKPVGTVWFGLADSRGATAMMRTLFGDRAGVRTRATVAALDLLRRSLMRGA